jgi:hypothetical protein
MKDNLRKEIEQAIEEHEEIHDFMVAHSNISVEKTDRMKFAGVVIKKVALLNKIVILDNLLEKYYYETYPLEGIYANEKKSFNMSIDSLIIKDDEVIYNKDYENAINSLQETLSKLNGKQ